MFHSLYPPISSANFPTHWQYPSEGPAPPSPVVVNTVPQYFGGRPTPPSTPPIVRATLTVDDYAPCPPTPRCVPSSVEEDELEWSNALNSGTSQSTLSAPRNYWFASELDHSTFFADPLTAETSNDSGDQARYDDPVADSERPSVSDRLLYSREIYARPSPVLVMMRRAALDLDGLQTQPIIPSADDEPLKLFSLTGGCTPMTGLNDVDQQSFKYYAKRPYPSPLRKPECLLSYRYSISTIEVVQHSLRVDWFLVYPRPIPPVIVRSRDLVGPNALSRRTDGFAFVVPTDDSIWGIIRQRGIDSDFRPMDPSVTVETGWCDQGDALYYPQHIVASDFAVNLFLELADSATELSPRCEYMGAYVLQVMDGLAITRSVWTDIDPEVQQSVYDRVPDRFEGPKHPSLGWPQLPYVRFCYYKWDRNIVGLADESLDRKILPAGQGIARCEAEGNLDDYSDHTDSGFDTDQYCDCDDEDTASTPSAYSPEQEYGSFIDFPSSA